MCCGEMNHAGEGRPTIVITITKTDQNVGRMLHAMALQRNVKIAYRVRVDVAGRVLEPRLVGRSPGRPASLPREHSDE